MSGQARSSGANDSSQKRNPQQTTSEDILQQQTKKQKRRHTDSPKYKSYETQKEVNRSRLSLGDYRSRTSCRYSLRSRNSNQATEYSKFMDLNQNTTKANLMCKIVRVESVAQNTVLYLYDGTDSKSWSYDYSFGKERVSKGLRLGRLPFRVRDQTEEQVVPPVGSVVPFITKFQLQDLESININQWIGIQNVVPVIFKGKVLVTGREDTCLIQLDNQDDFSVAEKDAICTVENYLKSKQEQAVVYPFQEVTSRSCLGARTLWKDGTPERHYEVIRDIQTHQLNNKFKQERSFRCLVRLLDYWPKVEDFVYQEVKDGVEHSCYYIQLCVEDNTGGIDQFIVSNYHAQVLFEACAAEFVGEKVEEVKQKMQRLKYQHNGLWMDCCIKSKYKKIRGKAQLFYFLFNTVLI